MNSDIINNINKKKFNQTGSKLKDNNFDKDYIKDNNDS